MKVDRGMLAVYLTADPDPGRYAINNVYIAPDRTAVATNGKVLVAVEPPDYNPKEDNKDNEMLLPAEFCRSLLSKIPKARSQEAYQFSEVEKRDKGKVSAKISRKDRSTDKVVTETHVTDLADGRFPKYQDVIPRQNGKDSASQAFVKVDLEYLEAICAVFRQFKGNAQEALTVELHLWDPDRSMIFRAKHPETDRRALAVLMPITTDVSGVLDVNAWERKHLQYPDPKAKPKKAAKKPEAVAAG